MPILANIIYNDYACFLNDIDRNSFSFTYLSIGGNISEGINSFFKNIFIETLEENVFVIQNSGKIGNVQWFIVWIGNGKVVQNWVIEDITILSTATEDTGGLAKYFHGTAIDSCVSKEIINDNEDTFVSGVFIGEDDNNTIVINCFANLSTICIGNTCYDGFVWFSDGKYTNCYTVVSMTGSRATYQGAFSGENICIITNPSTSNV